MAELTSKRRNALSDAMFGLPDERKYPMPDASHALNALARASEEHRKGRITDAQLASIQRKAHAMLKG